MEVVASTQALDEYVDKLPSPPRLVVPPPQTFHPELNSIPTQPSSIFEGLPIPQEHLRNEWGGWTYEERKNAQPILPCLWLGPSTVAKNQDFLKAFAFTFVVLVRHTRPGQTQLIPAAIQSCSDCGILAHTVDVSDNQALIASFPSTVRIINDHLRTIKLQTGRFGRVLICCLTGNELSAALVVAYLLETTELDLISALQLAQHQRFCINLDDATRHTLRAYEDIVRARRVVNNDPSIPTTPLRQSIMCNIPAEIPNLGRRGSKRTLAVAEEDDNWDGDVSMSGGEHTAQRDRAFAPFAGD